MEEQQPQSNPIQRSSARSFEEWRQSLLSIITNYDPSKKVTVEDDKIKPYYDQGLMPTVCFNELFNK